MFARSVSIHLKPKGISGFAQVIENHTIPLLRKQKGFQDEITLFVPGGSEAIEISLWDRKEEADAYGRIVTRSLAKALADVIQGDAEVRVYAVSNSTFHKIATPDFGEA